MHGVDWQWRAPDETWLDVPQLYRRWADAVDAGLVPTRHLRLQNLATSLVMFGDDEHHLAPALWVPMTRDGDYYDEAWEPHATATAFRTLADELDREVPPGRWRRGRG
jgi:hypothetical protein